MSAPVRFTRGGTALPPVSGILSASASQLVSLGFLRTRTAVSGCTVSTDCICIFDDVMSHVIFVLREETVDLLQVYDIVQC